ncbi:MAG TPA: FkbM family methyltransferase [Stellaceae bacterium]|nr:FkbM family methyltransferase [Stellaceae bacterium]
MSWRATVKTRLGHYAPPILSVIDARSSLQMDERCLREASGEVELHLIKYLCDEMKTSIDVGANHGRYTYVMRQYSQQVVSYEPVPQLARLLRYKFNIVSPSHVRVRNCAVSDRIGRASLLIPENAEWLSTIDVRNIDQISQRYKNATVAVDTVTLEELANLTIGMIKIDVEGHEVEAIAGAMSLIKRDRPNILVESEERHRPGSLKMIRDLLEPVGYQGYFVFGKEFVEIEQFSLDRMQSLSSLKADGTDRLAENLYINNFIFLTDKTTGAAVAGALKSSSTP